MLYGVRGMASGQGSTACSGRMHVDSGFLADTLPWNQGLFNEKCSIAMMNEVSSETRFKRYSLQGWIRYLWLKIRGRRLVVEGQCRLCGRCCHRISLEAGGRWLRHLSEFGRLSKKFPEYSRFHPVGSDSQGFLLFRCQWFDANSGTCSDHENRLALCRSYPDPELYFTGGAIHDGCGYRFREIRPFAPILAKEMAIKQTKGEDADPDR